MSALSTSPTQGLWSKVDEGKGVTVRHQSRAYRSSADTHVALIQMLDLCQPARRCTCPSLDLPFWIGLEPFADFYFGSDSHHAEMLRNLLVEEREGNLFAKLWLARKTYC